MYERVRVPDHETVKHAMVTLISEKKQRHLILTKKTNCRRIIDVRVFQTNAASLMGDLVVKRNFV